MKIEDEKRNVYLVGLMGAGKTTIAKALAKRLAYQFVDSDHEIEARTGVSLPTIFEIEGEEGFRIREAQVIDDLASLCGRVVATGGGAVLRAENRARLANSGLVIYLNVPLQTLCERTRHDKNRPLLQVSDPLLKLKELHERRDPLYRSIADLVVSGSRITAQSVLQLLLKEMKKPWKR
ncbi:MAG: Shikimate kinase 1 [Candidatus Accumulibacter appositus]|uniref:Shikimate kinase n=1 Tax=Candidatus Accumulibacter appositus TaxID=1454003 RepID=A0A011P5S1_9PROT|nr:shikimate kinase [Accumulibacter sp.]EXI82926.1 MAG: Shikimate kinase 1 [Candidatus Accumulibacter appositus]HRF04567.1 shikimate kinase [Accumulibacter sp.]